MTFNLNTSTNFLSKLPTSYWYTVKCVLHSDVCGSVHFTLLVMWRRPALNELLEPITHYICCIASYPGSSPGEEPGYEATVVYTSRSQL